MERYARFASGHAATGITDDPKCTVSTPNGLCRAVFPQPRKSSVQPNPAEQEHFAAASTCYPSTQGRGVTEEEATGAAPALKNSELAAGDFPAGMPGFLFALPAALSAHQLQAQPYKDFSCGFSLLPCRSRLFLPPAE